MISITERLRARQEPVGDGTGTWRPDGLCQEAADVIDAFVASLEDILPCVGDSAAMRYISYLEASRLVAEANSALSKAKGKQE